MTPPPQNPIPDNIGQDNGLSLYIHIPFCQTKCPYCDFNTYQGLESLLPPYLTALAAELTLWGRVLTRPPVNTIFFGGGTPSYLPPAAVGDILAAVQTAFQLQPAAEITLEANPGDLTAERAKLLMQQGVNRLSIGIQSLDNRLLALLGRRHNAAQAIAAVHTAQDAGLTNINLDLMYGLPRQSAAQWQDTLRQLTALNPAHISLYCLTLEEGTPLRRRVEQGQLPTPDPDLAADQYHYARELLAARGYRHYEISNWSRPGQDCRHNLAYWQNLPYLGVGPGAHSSLGGWRFWNQDSPRGYIAAVREWAEKAPPPLPPAAAAAAGLTVTGGLTATGATGGLTATAATGGLTADWLQQAAPIGGYEQIGPELAAAETMFLGLRLLDGLDLTAASTRLGIDLAAKYQTPIAELLDLGLLEQQNHRLRLTGDAYLIANQVFTRFME